MTNKDTPRLVKVLLLEDNPDDIFLTQVLLEDQNIHLELIVETDPAKALHNFRNGFENDPDVILMDMNMPKMNGITLLERLRETPKMAATPAFIFSGSVAQRDQTAADNAGATGYIEKPISREKVEMIADRCDGIIAESVGDSLRLVQQHA